MPPPDCGACGKIEPERMARIINAVLQNIEIWRDRALEISDHAAPENKGRALSLARDMEISRFALRRLAGMGADDDSGTG